MTNSATIENKISSTKKYLSILKSYQDYSRQEIIKSTEKRGAVERYLYLAVQSTIDLAEALASYKNFRKPSTLAESFTILEENDIIESELTQQLIKMVGFRNILAHDYGELDYDIVYDVLQNRLKDIKKFLDVVEGLIGGYQ